jgi:hypothetical protein
MSLWDNNRLQFARLLSEIYANIELKDEQWRSLEESMDLSRDEILSLFERADEVFQKSKRRV